MRLFVPITKIDEEKREVHGTLTQEIIDRDGEILDYDSSKPLFEKWSAYFAEQTNGKSVGNLRAMHRNVSAGKLTQIDFDDATKKINIVAKVIDDAEWAKCVEGVYTGFSAAGRVVKQWRDKTGNRRYTADPYEASLADFPCVPTATFSYMKTGGAIESRAFKPTARPERVPADYADPKTKRFPVKTKTAMRMSLARWSIPATRSQFDDATQESISRRLREAARSHGVTISEKTMMQGEFSKGLYEVSDLARAIQGLVWLVSAARYEREAEQDESVVPEMLLDQVAGLTETLKEMVGEEISELMDALEYDATFETAKIADTDDANGFAKRLAKGHAAKLTEIHDHAKVTHAKVRDAAKMMGECAKMMGEHCDKISGFAGEVSSSKTEKITQTDEAIVETKPDSAATAGTATTGEKVVEKTAGAGDQQAFEKLSGEVKSLTERVEKAEKDAKDATERADRFEKVAKDLAEAGEQMLAGVQSRGGALRSIGKGEDGPVGGEKKEKVAGEKEDAPKTPRDAFKQSFRTPRLEGGLPGQG